MTRPQQATSQKFSTEGKNAQDLDSMDISSASLLFHQDEIVTLYSGIKYENIPEADSYVIKARENETSDKISDLLNLIKKIDPNKRIELDLSNCAITVAHCKLLNEILAIYNITGLNLSGSINAASKDFFFKDTIRSVAGAADKRCLRHLYLSCNSITEAEMDIIPNRLINHLTILDLSGNPIGTGSLNETIKFFVTSETILTNLNLSGIAIGQESLIGLAQLLTRQSLTQLNSIEINNIGLTDGGLSILKDGLKLSQNLKSLHLKNNQLTLAGIRELVRVCIEDPNSTIIDLDFSDNAELDDDTIRYIVDVALNNNKICRIDFPLDKLRTILESDPAFLEKLNLLRFHLQENKERAIRDREIEYYQDPAFFLLVEDMMKNSRSESTSTKSSSANLPENIVSIRKTSSIFTPEFVSNALVINISNHNIEEIKLKLGNIKPNKPLFLNLKGCQITRYHIELLKEILEKRNIAGIDLSYSNIDDQMLGVLAPHLQNAVYLRSVNLSHTSISDIGVEKLVSKPENNNFLRILKLKDTNIENTGAQLALDFASQKQLYEFDLSSNNFNRLASKSLNDARKNISLLNLDNTKIIPENLDNWHHYQSTDLEFLRSSNAIIHGGTIDIAAFNDDIDAVMELIQNYLTSPDIKINLNLANCQLGAMEEEEFEKIISIIADNARICSVNLDDNQLGNQRAEKLFKTLANKNNQTLETISLSNNGINFSGAIKISDIIKDHKIGAKYLDFSNNPIGNKGAINLVNAQKQGTQTKIHLLHIKNIGLTDPGVLAFNEDVLSRKVGALMNLEIGEAEPFGEREQIYFKNTHQANAIENLQDKPIIEIKCGPNQSLLDIKNYLIDVPQKQLDLKLAFENYHFKDQDFYCLLSIIRQGNIIDLDLINANIAEENLQFLLLELLSHNQNLKNLKIGGNEITDKTLDFIEGKLPSNCLLELENNSLRNRSPSEAPSINRTLGAIGTLGLKSCQGAPLAI